MSEKFNPGEQFKSIPSMQGAELLAQRDVVEGREKGLEQEDYSADPLDRVSDLDEEIKDLKFSLYTDLSDKFQGKEPEEEGKDFFERNFPKDDSAEEQKRYADFLVQYPAEARVNIEGLRLAVAERDDLLGDEEVRNKWESLKDEEKEAKQKASFVLLSERRSREIADKVLDIKANAAQKGRKLTDVEASYLGSLEKIATDTRESSQKYLAEQSVADEVVRREAVRQAKELRAGFLETPEMRKMIEITLPSLAEGKPLLLSGETGGAKTALAIHLAKRYFGEEPELVSGHAEVNAYQVFGKAGLRATAEGATETKFDPGPLYSAMQEGRPIILDEIDAMPPSFLIRLNHILQLRPGDTLRIQENSNMPIEIKPGFCIIATANMKSGRYQREEMDTAFLQRFRDGAGIEHVGYPDSDVEIGDLPVGNMKLAMAFLTDRKGNVDMPRGVDKEALVAFLKMSHTSQKMFTEPAVVAGGQFVDSQRVATGRTALEKGVLAPREWMGILNQVISTDGKLTLDDALGRFVSGLQVPSDREVMSKLAASHGFLNSISEKQLRIPKDSLEGFRS